jgi:truncated hemoglobin YjbI
MEKQQPASLSGRIGGQESVRRLVEIFYDSVGQEPEEHPYADTRRRSDVPKKKHDRIAIDMHACDVPELLCTICRNS